MRSPIVGATLRGLALGYPLALLIFIVSLRLVGERWWGTTIALYLPRFPFALPLLPLIGAIVWIGPRRLLWTQLLACVLLLDLTGFRVAWPTPALAGALHLRIVSCNINGGALGLKRIMTPLLALDPDIIVLQEVGADSYAGLRQLAPGYTVREMGQYWLASRFPVSTVNAPQIGMNGMTAMPFAQYRLITPAGPVMLFNVHPTSPRYELDTVRGDGVRHQLARGDLFNASVRDAVTKNVLFRLTQIRAIADGVRGATGPVLLAGDTNLPDLSWAFAQWLGGLTDGFGAAGAGFGYSFPSPRNPWMRIDRILADPRHFRFRSIEVISSDHYAVTAELDLLPSG